MNFMMQFKSRKKHSIATLGFLGMMVLFNHQPVVGISLIDPVGEGQHQVTNAQQISQKSEVQPDLGKHFQALGISGSIMIYDLQRDRWYQHNSARNTTPFSPASTFKILNSLIALETQVIPDENTVIPWDGVQREIAAWNRDFTMREAMKASTVWFYQILARRVGYEQMKQWVSRSGYGDQMIGTPADIDRFWLEGPLKITPQEQIQFLRKLYRNELPFSERSVAIVKDIMIVEKTPNYTVRAKTGWSGWGDDSTIDIGWYVGYVEQNQEVYFFATNIDLPDPKMATARKEVTYRCLKELGLL